MFIKKKMKFFELFINIYQVTIKIQESMFIIIQLITENIQIMGHFIIIFYTNLTWEIVMGDFQKKNISPLKGWGECTTKI